MSPWWMTVSYCAFLSDGRFVSTTPFTLSIVQCRRPDAMNRESSLEVRCVRVEQTGEPRAEGAPVYEFHAYAERTRETVKR